MKKTIFTPLILAPFLAALTACGGSSDSSNDSPLNSATLSESSLENDSIGSAQAMQSNATLSGHLDGESDYFDFYSLDVIQGNMITVQLTGGADTDLDITLRDSGNYQVAYSDDLYSTEYFDYTPTYSGKMYIGVEHLSGPASNYSLSYNSSGLVTTTLGAEFCVDATFDNQSQYQISDGTNPSSVNAPQLPGLCPNNNYVSQCRIVTAGVITNMLFSQEYVDLIGGHERVSSDLCRQFNDDGMTAVYTTL